MKKFSKGFTIIELIVVIAIIAVLAGIVLVNVTQYINKGKNSAIQADMATFITNSAIWFADPVNSGKTGDSFIVDTNCYGGSLQTAIEKAGGTDFNCLGAEDSPNWCLSVTMPTGGQYTKYCVDSSGYKGELGASGCDGTNNRGSCI